MKIEEITDQVERAMKVSQDQQPANSPPQTQTQTQTEDGQQQQTEGAATAEDDAEATKPALPPGLAMHSGKTADDILAELNKSPLFMTELEDNDDIAALQALNYEGTASENGASFKERGNECFKVKGYMDAKEFYTKGIQILAVEERKRSRGEITKSMDGDVDSPEEIAEQKKILEALYMNRAACHLELGNYRSCWLDCAGAIRLNAKNVKAHYRSAKALLAVDRIEEADDVCARGLELDGDNAALKTVADAIVRRAKIVDAKHKKEAERIAKEHRRRYLLKAALQARGIRTAESPRPPDTEDAKIELTPDPDDPTSSLSFPTVLLYPKDLESDFIKAFNEQQTLEDHLGYVFPLPWDSKGRYTVPGVDCFVETKSADEDNSKSGGGGLMKMGKRMSLLKVLSTGKVVVMDQVVRVYVVPKGEADEWVKDFKEKRAVEAGRKS